MDKPSKWEDYLHLVEFYYNDGYQASLKMIDTRYYKQTLPNASSLPILMVYPSHTSLTYLILHDLPSLFVHMILGDMLC